MPKVSTAKAEREPKKPSVRAPAPDHQVNTSAPETVSLASPTQAYSPQQIIQLQRTLGNKAVGDLIRRQKASAEPAIQRTVEAAPAHSSSKVRLRTSARVIQPLFGFGKKKAAAPVAVATPAPVISAPKEAPKGVLPAPAVLDSDVKASVEQKASPIAALKTYRGAIGTHLEEAKRHKFKIDRYKTFLEADFINLKSNVPLLISEENALSQREAAMARLPKAEQEKVKTQRKELNKRKDKVNENPADALSNASVRVKKAYNAKAVSDAELPVIEYAYDELVKMRHDDLKGVKHGFLFGSGAHKARRDHYQKKLDMAILIGNSRNVSIKVNNTNLRDIPKYTSLVAKHQKRMDFVAKAEQDLVKAETLRGQAKLSEGYMGFKRKELKTAKQEVKATKRNVQLGDHLLSKVSTAAQGFVVSTATLGLVELEQNKTDGGYSSKRETVTILDSWKRDWSALKAVWATRPYGKMTALHLFFQGLGSLILKPLRKMFTAAALIFTGLSLIPIPGLAAITGPLAAFCTLVTLGLVAAKMALDTVLTTWSALTLALNKNAHNTDTLRGQTRGQATDVLAGAVAVGAAFAVPAIGNAAGGSYLNPLQNPQGGGSIMDYKPGSAGGAQGMFNGDMYVHQLGVQGAKLPSTIGMTVAEKGVGALGELEGLSLGARQLFKVRQEEIMKNGKSPAENFLALRNAELDALVGAKVKLQITIEDNQQKPDKVKAAKEQLAANQVETERVMKLIAAGKSAGVEAQTMEAGAKAAPQIDARGLPAAGPQKEMQKERLVRQASTRNLGEKAKSQIAALISPLGESQAQGSELASGAKAVEKGVAAAGSKQGVQPVDSPNASAAQSSVSAAKEIMQQVVEIAHEAPAAVDEALAPAPKPA